MTYSDGTPVWLGDRVTLSGMPGRVVCDIDHGGYTDAFTEAHWAYLERGVMVETEGAGLIWLERSDEDLSLVARGEQ